MLGAGAGDVRVRGALHPALSADGRWIAFSWHGDLWRVPWEGGRAERLTSAPADERRPAWSPDGASLAYSSDERGNRDLFVLDLKSRASRTLTSHSEDDDAPAWSPDGAWIAFQSTRDSNLDLALNNRVWDLWKVPAAGGTPIRITRFRGENPCWSTDGKRIAYDRYSSGYADGEHDVFVISSDGKGIPTALATGSEDSRKPVLLKDAVVFAHEANGLQTADDSRNLWRASLDGGALIQLTGHRGDHVTSPSASPATGRIAYEYDFDLWTLEPGGAPRKLEVVASDVDPPVPLTSVHRKGFRGASWSPSGSELVFSLRGDLWTAQADGSGAKSLTGGDGEDRDPAWMPDGRSVLYVSSRWDEPAQVWEATPGARPRRLTREAGDYRHPRPSPDGKRFLVTRIRDGRPQILEVDLLSGEARVRVDRDAEWGTWVDRDRIAYLSGGEVFVEVPGQEPRAVEAGGGRKSALAASPDGSKLACSSSAPRISVIPIVGGASTVVAKSSARELSWSPDGSMLLASQESRNEAGSGTLAIHDLQGEAKLDLEIAATRTATLAQEMLDVFRQVWTAYRTDYYDPWFHGQDMAALREKYAPLAASCRTGPELHDLINDMIRELKSSHIQFTAKPPKNTRWTGYLGVDLDAGFVVVAVEPDGPAAKAGIRAGERLTAVGDADLVAGADLDAMLSLPADAEPLEVALAVKDAGGDVRTVRLKPVGRSALRELKYANRIAARKRRVKELSGGKLGYHHIRFMQQVEVDRLKRAMETEFPEASALVLDVRDGVGGFAHRPLCALLDGSSVERLNAKPACWTRDRDGTSKPDVFPKGQGAPSKSWNRPVILVQNEISRSDKEIFPHTFRHLGLGYLVGMPTAGGVIGGGDRTLTNGSRITVSVQGWFTGDGRNMEGWGVPPDYRVPETHADLDAGRDAALEKAVEVLLGQLDGRVASPRGPASEPPPQGR
jgi:tricorn protease